MHAVQADRRGRLGLILERDGPTCVWCGERRGWRVDRARMVRTSEALTEAIGRRGGQRRARPWLAAQLRRPGKEAAC